MTQGETKMTSYDLEDAIMMLHNIARTIEREWGFNSSLPNDVRGCADRLAHILHAEVPAE
ncbi:hypothetical protein UFOVP112_322 [uncultured Caudovirales phage]|uniref:Uncharacterized protein n=1 Tax=uncultured Caudovirales phage TaxID=2100421 RepID=A0A6J5L480_9CAUD|nr:hypothetical protein UFOVP112_322 [uncultured Caudovirales phage]